MYITMKPYIIKYVAFAILLKDGKFSLDIQFFTLWEVTNQEIVKRRCEIYFIWPWIWPSLGPKRLWSILLKYNEIKKRGYSLFYSSCAFSIQYRNRIPDCWKKIEVYSSEVPGTISSFILVSREIPFFFLKRGQKSP